MSDYPPDDRQQSKMKMKLGRVVELLMVQTQHQTKTQNHVAVLEKKKICISINTKILQASLSAEELSSKLVDRNKKNTIKLMEGFRVVS